MKQKNGEMLVYEYAVIRYVPKVERDEFLNIGLLFFCKSKRKLFCDVHLDVRQVDSYSSELDFDTLQQHVEAFKNVALGVAKESPISFLEVDERFRWLSAVKSSCIQTSRPHVGLCDEDLEKEFRNLFIDLVL